MMAVPIPAIASIAAFHVQSFMIPASHRFPRNIANTVPR